MVYGLYDKTHIGAKPGGTLFLLWSATSFSELKIQRRSRRAGEMSAYHRVYLVKYASPLKKAEYHDCLFVSRKPEPEDGSSEEEDPKGAIYDVQGPLKISHTEMHFTYDYLPHTAPMHSVKFRVLQHIGRVKASKRGEINQVCIGIPPPRVPITFTGEFPNCTHWINNVLYKLHKKRIVEFLADFQVPSEEVDLVSRALRSSSEGASNEGSSSKGSSSKGSSSKASSSKASSSTTPHKTDSKRK